MSDINTSHPSYMEGFLDGYKLGEDRNPYNFEDSGKLLYKEGYAAGVTYYCNENHPEDEGK